MNGSRLHNDHAAPAKGAYARYISPFRYPGGKASLAPFLTRLLRLNSLLGCAYYEPFAGGAGAALRLLHEGTVSQIHLNDADVRIFAVWHTILAENQKFSEAIRNARVSMSEWRRQFEICHNPKGHTRFDVAFSTLFLNRCNRSGVILGSGPIGGLAQRGAFDMWARFNREALAERVNYLATFADAIHVHNMDALHFLKRHLPRGAARSKVFVYLDPPYYRKGKRLYLNYYSGPEHTDLRDYMHRQRLLNWVMSYDDDLRIIRLYRTLLRARITVGYSLNRCRRAQELIIAPHHLKIPRGPLAGANQLAIQLTS